MLSIDQCWKVLESRITGEQTLPPGASKDAIRQAETQMGCEFPEDYRQSLRRHNGSGACFIFPYKIGGGEQWFLSLKNSIEIWGWQVKAGAEFEEEGEFGEQDGPIKKSYWNKSWIPITDDMCGDNIYLDLDPGEGGSVGQVVDWWHEGGVSTFQAASFREWLNEVVEKVRSGEYQFQVNKFNPFGD